MDVPENRITPNTPFAEYEKISVFAGLKRIDEIGDYDSRVIYAFSGQFGNFFITKSNDFYTLENRIPKSLTDLLDTTGSTQLVITDNFNYFAELLEDSDAVFKCGYDDDLDVVYVHLEINGELLISYCHALDGYESSIEIESVNMENPIISNENISEIKIPTGYLISLRDVPAGI